MKKRVMNNVTVIVVGADHQNTLGIIRACAKEGCYVHLIVHAEAESCSIRCCKSKFLNGTIDVVPTNEEKLIDVLMTKSSENKVAVIPTSDFAALCIDNHYDELKQYFYLPSISGKQGAIAQWMDKYFQFKSLSDAGFQIARTSKIDLENVDEELSKWQYPVVFKPVVSAYGAKSDIVVINDFDEAIKYSKVLFDKGYTEILIQEYIQKEYELVCFGSITTNGRSPYYGTLKKIRYYPYNGGASLSYAKYIDANVVVSPIINYLRDMGYNGLFDIELFYLNGEVYINEINFRNSGNTWAIVKKGMNAPMAWVADAFGIGFKTAEAIDSKGAFMNETSDLHYLIDRKIGIVHWLRDLLQVRAFNKFWIKDLAGSLIWYRRNN